MRVYHVAVEQEDDWYCARALEDAAVFTQGRTLDEIVENVREVVELLYQDKDVQIELLVPRSVNTAARATRRGNSRRRMKV